MPADTLFQGSSTTSRRHDSALLAVLVVVPLDDCPIGSIREGYGVARSNAGPVEAGDSNHTAGGVDQAIPDSDMIRSA